MHAIIIREFGGPEVLKYEEVETPEPGPEQVLVQVKAVSVNRTLDLSVREGKAVFPVTLPHVPGSDPSGIVVEVGSSVTRIKVGDRVTIRSEVICGECKGCRSNLACMYAQHVGVECWGGYADYIAVNEQQAFVIEDAVDFATASYISRHFSLARRQIRGVELDAGDSALVMGAAGALGTLLIQLLAAGGVRVIGAAGSDERVAHGIAYGAAEGVNYRQENLAERVFGLTEGKGVKVVFENIGDPVIWKGAFDSLGFGGTIITAGYHGGGVVPLDVRRLHFKRLSVKSTNAPRVDANQEIAEGMRLAASGKVRAPIGARLHLSQAAQAHEMLARSAVSGKVILEP